MTPDRLAEIREAARVFGEHPVLGFACCTAHDAADAVPELLAEVDRLRKALSGAADQVAERDDELGGVHTELDRLRRENQHHQNSKARWRSRAEKAEARVAELEELKPARFQDCQKCGAGYEYGQSCTVCAFKASMTAEHAEGLAGLDAMRADHPSPCRVPDGPDCTCQAEEGRR
ncbi:hypothetical protein [Streptomyces sp. NPDC005780]|uniref:hypothetical protein n=1 Tax=Streptomyces sp. NPDC005780 TaxID=3364730 RepID=UPI0036C36CDE